VAALDQGQEPGQFGYAAGPRWDILKRLFNEDEMDAIQQYLDGPVRLWQFLLVSFLLWVAMQDLKSRTIAVAKGMIRIINRIDPDDAD
jgi:hypothetical protein